MIDIENTEKITIKEFADALASSDPVPGGGGVSAYVAALGAALGSMVGALTTGKKKYAETEEELQGLMERLEAYRAELFAGIKEDADCFLPLAKAYSLPESTPEEKEEKQRKMEGLLLEAARTPLALMRKISDVLSILERLSEIGSRLAISDVGVGASMCRAAMESASLNVFINTKFMQDRVVAEELNDEARELVSAAQVSAEDIMAGVMEAIS